MQDTLSDFVFDTLVADVFLVDDCVVQTYLLGVICQFTIDCLLFHLKILFF